FATDHNSVVMGDSGIISAIPGSHLPNPAVFLYTTLFRSVAVVAHWRRRRDRERGATGEHVHGFTGDRPERRELLHPHAIAEEPADRKSTRLNSSHQIISYAVFCLKKKTIDKAGKELLECT